MKKAFSLVLLCSCLFLIYQFGINLIKQTHKVTYNIRSNRTLEVIETFKNSSYYFEIISENYKFYYKENNLFNKNKNVIENIEIKEENGTLCIYPVYKNKEKSTIMCSDKNKVYTYESLKNTSLVSSFYADLKAKDYKFKFELEKEQIPEQKDRVTYYPTNFEKNEVLTLWNYQGFTIFNNDRSLNVYTLDFDRYENTISKLVTKYYVTPIYNNNKLFEFSKVNVYDILTNKEFELELGQTLSNYTYVNGITNNKLYLMDPSNIVQIAIDIKNKEVEVVGNKDKNGIYYNGKIEERNIYDFVNRKLVFTMDDKEIKTRYSYETSYENKDSYFFYDGSKLYQVYKDKLDLQILILDKSNLKEIKVINDNIYYINENKIYKYTKDSISVPLLMHDELLYNSSNIYDVYK